MKTKYTESGTIGLIAALAIGVIALGTVIFLSGSNTAEDDTAQAVPDVQVADSDAMVDATVDAPDTMIDQAPPETMVAGSYEAYTPDKVARAAEGDVVLFFKASWCPSCRAADKAIREGTVPEGVSILEVDYDTAIELRKKYGVTTQHTFVQVDADGNEIGQWAGQTRLADILEKIS